MGGTPRREELFAYEVVERHLGVPVEHHDLGGAHGAVDGLIGLGRGRVGALEVTTIADPSAMRSESVLASTFPPDWVVPSLQWSWIVWVRPSVNPLDLFTQLPTVLKRCEEAGVTAPDRLAEPLPDWLELYDGEKVTLTGTPQTTRPGSVDVLPDISGGGGAPDDATALTDWIDQTLLADAGIARHLVKLFDHPADEHHLFVRVSESAMEFPERYVLEWSSYAPDRAPRVPAELNGLWLHGRFGVPAIWLRESGWTRPRALV